MVSFVINAPNWSLFRCPFLYGVASSREQKKLIHVIRVKIFKYVVYVGTRLKVSVDPAIDARQDANT